MRREPPANLTKTIVGDGRNACDLKRAIEELGVATCGRAPSRLLDCHDANIIVEFLLFGETASICQ